MSESQHPEVLAIQMILERRCLGEMLKAGLREEHFSMLNAKEAFSFLIDYSKEAGQEGSVPSTHWFQKKHIWYSPGVIPDAMTPVSLTKEIIDLSLQREAAGVAAELSIKPYKSLEDLELAIGKMRTVLDGHKQQVSVTAGESVDLVRQWYKEGKEKGITGLPYPWDALNTKTRGMHPGDYVILYGRPKQGKTSVCIEILAHVLTKLQPNQHVLFVSYEMTRTRLMNRLACKMAKLRYDHFNEGKLTEAEEQMLELALADLETQQLKYNRGIHFMGPAIETTRSRSKRTKGCSVLDIEQKVEEVNPVLVIADGILHASDTRTKKRARGWDVMSNISSDIKLMALTYKVPTIVVHQANREGEKEVNIDSQRDIGYSDAWGQDTDLSLKITRIRPKRGTTDPPQTLIQTKGTREFQMLGFTITGKFFDDTTFVEEIVDEKKLIELLRRAQPDVLDEASVKTAEKFAKDNLGAQSELNASTAIANKQRDGRQE